MKNKKAILLCAGRGSRLGQLTNHCPKPLVTVNGVSILENAVQQLLAADYNHLTVVIGYKGEKIKSVLAPYQEKLSIEFLEKENWTTTNNIYSLWLARHALEGGVTLLEGDIFFDASVLAALGRTPSDQNSLLVSPLSSLMEGAIVEADRDSLVIGFDSTKTGTYQMMERPLKTLNIYRLSKEFCHYLVTELEREIEAGNVTSYYEQIFSTSLQHGHSFAAVEVPPQNWYEIDNAYDLRISEFQFSDQRHNLLKRQHGGYWRYPIKDHALIYNLHFPPDDLKQRMKDRFDDLMLNYPSRPEYAASQLAQFLNLEEQELVIANGVAEFIKVLPNVLTGKVVLVEPSFNEYASCFGDQVIPFRTLEKDAFQLDFTALAELAHRERPEAIVIVTPDNPTGRLHKKEDLVRLYEATDTLGTLLVIDESFIDFSDKRETSTFLNELHAYPRVLVLRSMSKTFGIGGLRLGYAAGANLTLVERLRRKIPIWNLNGFAEEFILNLPTYEKEYQQSCQFVREETDELVAALRRLDELHVFDTDANFVLCKIKGKRCTADQLARILLKEFNIYIKECSGKSMEDGDYFLRISSRTRKENEKLVQALGLLLHRVAEENAFLTI